MSYYTSRHTGKKIDDTIDYVTNPNLLDNWYFLNLVNQRDGYIVPSGTAVYTDSALTTSVGLSSQPYVVTSKTNSYVAFVNADGDTRYASASAAVSGYTGKRYSIDRWAMNGNSVSIVAGAGIKLTAASGVRIQMLQPFPNPELIVGKTVTLSLLVTEMSGGSGTLSLNHASGAFANASTSISKNFSAAGLITATGVVSSTSYPIINTTITAGPGVTMTVIAVKLELGSQQTLAHQDENYNWVLNEIPDYGEQLQECQRYFERIRAVSYNASIGIGTGTATDLYVPIKLHPKRANPASFSANQVANVRYGTNVLSSTPTAVSIYANDNNSGMYTLLLKGSYTAGTTYRAGLVAGASLDFSADI